MSRRGPTAGFAARPSDPEAWVRSPDSRTEPTPAYTARLTVDVTPELRARIKVTAFGRGLTVADMLRVLRVLLEREFADMREPGDGGAP